MATSVNGADVTWTGAPGTPLSFTDPANWAGNQVPGGADNALINNGGVATLSTAAGVSNLRLGVTAGTSGTMQQSSGAFNAGDQIRVGDAGTGTYVLSGGTVSHFNEFMMGAGSGGNGTLRISGGTINSQFHFIPGAGTNSVGNVVQTGGHIDVPFPAVVAAANGLGSSSTWDMSAGTVNTSEFYVGANGNGTFNLSGTGFVQFSINAHIGAGPTGVGTFVMTGGTVVGTNPGGSHFLVGQVGTATVLMSGGSINVPRINLGQNTAARGVMHQSGGTVTVDTAMVIAEVSHNANLYDISGGSLVLSDEASMFVGSSNGEGTIRVRDSGNVSVAFHTFVGSGTPSFGTLSVTGGSFGVGAGTPSIGGFLVIGDFGTGRMSVSGGSVSADVLQFGRREGSGSGIGTQTGGTVTVRDVMHVGQASPLDNHYDISGGTLNVTNTLSLGLITPGVATLNVSGTAHIDVGGALAVGTGFGTQTGGTGTVNVSGGSLAVGSFAGVGNVLITGGTAQVRPNGTATATSRVNTLAISGAGRFDLTNNALVIDYTGPTPIADVRADVAGAFAGGAWTGAGLTSSSANNTTHGLGYAEASALASVDPIFGTVDADAVLVRYTRYGDANVDGQVNLADFNRLASNFGATNAFWHQGDFNYDGNVNLQDFNRLAANFGLSAAGPTVTPDDWARLGAAVPEPSSVALLGLGAVSGLRRRRSR